MPRCASDTCTLGLPLVPRLFFALAKYAFSFSAAAF
jgi:hypothetical protein